MNQKQGRQRRARKTRAKIAELKAVRLLVHRTNLHIYAQIIDASGSKVLASASTLDKAVRATLTNGGTTAAATAIGKQIAEKAKAAGIETVAFDRSGLNIMGASKLAGRA